MCLQHPISIPRQCVYNIPFLSQHPLVSPDCGRARHSVSGDVCQGEHQHRAGVPGAGQRDTEQDSGQGPRQPARPQPPPQRAQRQARAEVLLVQKINQKHGCPFMVFVRIWLIKHSLIPVIAISYIGLLYVTCNTCLQILFVHFNSKLFY